MDEAYRCFTSITLRLSVERKLAAYDFKNILIVGSERRMGRSYCTHSSNLLAAKNRSLIAPIHRYNRSRGCSKYSARLLSRSSPPADAGTDEVCHEPFVEPML